MAWALVLEGCSVAYRGRSEKASEGEVFLVAVKDDGCVALQRLQAGTEPAFWNGAGVVQLAFDDDRVRLRAVSFAGEVLECSGRASLLRSFDAGRARGRVFVAQGPELPPAVDPAALRPPRDRPLTPHEDRVLTALKTWRTREARQRKVSPFVVASNRCLEAVVRARPRSLDDLAYLEGMGPVRVGRYGAQMLALLAGLG